MKLNRNLNEEIRARREEMGLTLEEFAEMCEMSDKGIEKIELGISNPKWTNVLKIANVLKIDLVILMRRRRLKKLITIQPRNTYSDRFQSV